MGRAIDLFVTYRFIKLLVTPFEKTDAFRLGIIDNIIKTDSENTTIFILRLINITNIKGTF